MSNKKVLWTNTDIGTVGGYHQPAKTYHKRYIRYEDGSMLVEPLHWDETGEKAVLIPAKK